MERPSEEDNGRQKWMIGEKDKQIKEVQGKYQASEAYALRERLQECMEALEVMANLQAQQLQYLEDNALAKLTKMDDQARSLFTLVPIRPRRRGERRSLRTFPGASLRPGSLAFNPRPRRLSTPLLTPLNSTPISSLVWTSTLRSRTSKTTSTRSASTCPSSGRSCGGICSSGDDALVPIMASLAGFTREAAGDLLDGARGVFNRGLGGLTRRFTGFGARLGGRGAFYSHWSPYDRVGVVNADP